MFREMRRARQALSRQECEAILDNATSGVLALPGDDDYPYAVPLSFVYKGGKILFHGAKVGHKVDAMSSHEKCSFCVIEQDQPVLEEYTTYFRSVIAFGKIRVLSHPEEMRTAIHTLADKYAPPHETRREQVIASEWDALAIYEMTVEHLSGKEAIELVRAKEKNPM